MQPLSEAMSGRPRAGFVGAGAWVAAVDREHCLLHLNGKIVKIGFDVRCHPRKDKASAATMGPESG